MAGVGRPISYHAGAKPYQLRVQFSPEWLPTGKLGLRVKPQIGVPDASGSRDARIRCGAAGHFQLSGAGLRERSFRPKLAGPTVSRPLLGAQAPGYLRFHANHPADFPGRRRTHRSGAVGAGAFLRSGFSNHLPGGRAGRAHRMVHAAAHGRRCAGRRHVRTSSRREPPAAQRRIPEHHLTLGPSCSRNPISCASCTAICCRRGSPGRWDA